ncbi:MAG: hypothetical protein Q9N34_01375 [Aquificota bacterium]|nr:hypothetical protein [Aquificota bacterium]
MMILKIASFVLLLLLTLIFSYFNLQSVKVSFFGGSVTLPLFLVVFISFSCRLPHRLPIFGAESP